MPGRERDIDLRSLRCQRRALKAAERDQGFGVAYVAALENATGQITMYKRAYLWLVAGSSRRLASA